MQREAKRREVGGMDLQGKGMARSNENCKDEEAVNKPKTGDIDNTRKSELKCVYANVRSIIDIEKRMELELYVDKEEPDIIGLTETWAKEEIADSELLWMGMSCSEKTGKIKQHEDTGVCCCMSKTISQQYKEKISGVINSKSACGARSRQERREC